MCFQGLVIVDFTNSNYPPLEMIGLVVSRSQVKTVEFPEKQDSRYGDMTEFPVNRDSVVKGLRKMSPQPFIFLLNAKDGIHGGMSVKLRPKT